jgi:hypothetical protein
MAIFECRLEEAVAAPGHYVFPVPMDTHEQKITDIGFEDCQPKDTIQDRDGSAKAFLFDLKEGQSACVRLTFEEPGPGLAAAFFVARDNRFERPSQALIDQIAGQFHTIPLSERVPMLIQFIADHFTYGRREATLGDEDEAMPALECGLTPGTCVDMHTLGVAALRSLNVKAAYIMGCHVSDARSEYYTGHCWMNVRHEDVPHHWDISHHVQYGVRTITPVLNPKPGRRFALSVGRGRVFEGVEGAVEFPALSGFHALDGSLKGEKLKTIGRFRDA